MPDDQSLQQARRELEATVPHADDAVRDDLREVAGELAAIEQDDQQADHAVVDGYLNQLRQAKQETDADVEDDIDDVIEALSAYRDGLEGA
ncbi:hypothetical protein Halru_0207 [Halovivax ruber XH-70]|uniref:Uncharacterized protein n=1 Tax=Halovivax ruber (strain DSM 18193 / JCM 13892 / XH-70) TaxID=797302 RepID=L0I7V0_HALRX|nr:hypothetical protein [Halovivax ruber]AGB14853.1 hypothetical protein Halru_0207 [Halovivax ruber XH-70]